MQLLKNITRRIKAVAIQTAQAERPGISTTAKSCYYRAAIILTCTIVEALVCEIVRAHSKKNKFSIEKTQTFKKIHKFPRKVFNKDNYWVVEVYTENINQIDSATKFQTLNNYLKSIS